MRLGNSPINWSNEDLRELGGDVPLERCLEEMQISKFEGTEFGYKFPTDPEQLCTVLADYELALASSWHSFNVVAEGIEPALAKLEEKVTFLAACGAEHINLCDTSRTVHTNVNLPLSHRPAFTDAEWDTLTEGLNRAGEVCLKHGVTPGYHPHMGTGVQTAAETARLMANTDPGRVWLCPDSGHALFAGDDPLAFFEQNLARISHVHFKDIRTEVLERARASDWPFLKATVEGVFTVPGDGDIDFAPLVACLQRARYDGWIIVEAEQYLPGTDPLTYAKKCHSYLGWLLDQA